MMPMRHFSLILWGLPGLFLGAGTALAGSIDRIDSTEPPVVQAVFEIVCSTCADHPRAQDRAPTYLVPELGTRDEKIELQRIHGALMLVRTEAWFGGSPVRIVTKPTPEAMAAYLKARNIVAGDTLAGNPGETGAGFTIAAAGIDSLNTTAALAPAEPLKADSVDLASEKSASSQVFDRTGFQLRLN
ncbi:hypothetical protein BJF92_03590 [Rhizobium rhizosphaerae]|uniref:Uncharacterized protein n=2 Tax=Xaviernesmea rhizosphaerae TaxID=1672749 RepID=A0A1Q9AGY8_9HYPH|nr:hypothetical protein BJF92_03590 [Xaviernesmea rhizosphaerae]